MHISHACSRIRSLWIATRAVLTTAVLLCILYDSARACSVCRCGDDRFFINGAQRINHGGLIVLAEYFSTSKTSALGHEEGEEMTLGRVMSLSSIQAEPGEFEVHDQSVLRALFLFGLTERITLLGSVPYTMNTIKEGGMTEEANGFSDPEITAIADLFESEEGDFELNASLGTRLPLGKANETDEAGTRLDQHLQTGTGAWGVMAGVQAAHPMLAVPLFYSFGYQANASNSHDFSYGNVVKFNVATQLPVTSTIRLLAEANARYAERDKEGEELDQNSGGTMVYLSPGLRLSLPMGLALRGQVQIPIVENLFGIQDEKVNFQVGLSIAP